MPQSSKKSNTIQNWLQQQSTTKCDSANKADEPRKKKFKKTNGKSLVQYINLQYSALNPNEAVQLTCNPKQFYNLKLSTLSNDIVRMEIPLYEPKPAAQSPLNIDAKQLLNWPGLCTVLQLGDVTIRRKLVANYCRDVVVVGADTVERAERSTNKLEYHRLNRHGNGSELSSLMLDTILQVYLKALPHGGLLPLRMTELSTIFNEIKTDLTPFERIMKHVTYTRFLTRDHFVRSFHPNAKDAPKKVSDSKVYLRETINPEVHLTVVQCPFVMGCDEGKWSEAVYDEFVKVFDGNPASLATLNGRYKMCLTFECLECSDVEPMSGILSVYSAKQHMAMHYQDKPNWTCSYCKLQQSQEELARIGWKHTCL